MCLTTKGSNGAAERSGPGRRPKLLVRFQNEKKSLYSLFLATITRSFEKIGCIVPLKILLPDRWFNQVHAKFMGDGLRFSPQQASLADGLFWWSDRRATHAYAEAIGQNLEKIRNFDFDSFVVALPFGRSNLCDRLKLNQWRRHVLFVNCYRKHVNIVGVIAGFPQFCM